MATILREKTTGEFFFMWVKLSTKEDVCEYAINRFNGTVFQEVERKRTTNKEYVNFMSRFDTIEEAPVESIFEKGLNVVFWNDYFKKLKTENAPSN
jgi:hypothetical protein